MKLLNNVGPERLGDTLASSIGEGGRLSIISAYFTVFAYRELKEEFSKADSVRFLFSEPTFVKAVGDAEDPRRFELERRRRERGVSGVGLERTGDAYPVWWYLCYREPGWRRTRRREVERHMAVIFEKIQELCHD
ncbi:MAG: hypothetical protein KHZ24_10855 [Coriobacteriia bacterium]|nr:hypothetical protein [Coriobacteriia bacterium]